MRFGDWISVGNQVLLKAPIVAVKDRRAGMQKRLKTGLALHLNPRYTSIFAELFMTARDEYDPLAPQREAAFFYGLFLRGHNVDALRQDIDVPRAMLEKWMRANDFEASFRENLRRVYAYRKQVLAIFDGLVLNEQNRPPVQ